MLVRLFKRPSFPFFFFEEMHGGRSPWDGGQRALEDDPIHKIDIDRLKASELRRSWKIKENVDVMMYFGLFVSSFFLLGRCPT